MVECLDYRIKVTQLTNLKKKIYLRVEAKKHRCLHFNL